MVGWDAIWDSLINTICMCCSWYLLDMCGVVVKKMRKNIVCWVCLHIFIIYMWSLAKRGQCSYSWNSLCIIAAEKRSSVGRTVYGIILLGERGGDSLEKFIWGFQYRTKWWSFRLRICNYCLEELWLFKYCSIQFGEHN